MKNPIRRKHVAYSFMQIFFAINRNNLLVKLVGLTCNYITTSISYYVMKRMPQNHPTKMSDLASNNIKVTFLNIYFILDILCLKSIYVQLNAEF